MMPMRNEEVSFYFGPKITQGSHDEFDEALRYCSATNP